MNSYNKFEIKDLIIGGLPVTDENLKIIYEPNFQYSNKHCKLFKDFYIDSKPLSSIITEISKSKSHLTLNWFPVFGCHLSKEMEQIKIKQLLLKEIEEKEIINSFPIGQSKSYLKDYIKNYKYELSQDYVLLYICSECGDFYCGGIKFKITKDEDCFIWEYQKDEDENIEGNLILKFNKQEYFETLNNYLTRP